MTLLVSQPNYFDHTEVGAPTLAGPAGGVVEVLRACFANGFNPRPISGITVAGEVATATAASHGYTATFGKLLLVEGVSEPLLNGRKQPLSVTTNTFTFAAPGVADGAYSTGTMSAKRAPLGWAVAHINGESTAAIFARTSPEASASKLRVIDTKVAPASTRYCVASMVESATDINTVTNEVPAALENKVWQRGADTAAAKKWVIVGTHKRAWVMLQGSDGHTQVVPYIFGDPMPLYAGDNLGAVLAGYGSGAVNAVGGANRSTPGSFVPAGGIALLNFQRNLLGDNVGVTASLCGSGLWGESLYAAGGSTQVPIVGDYYLKTSTEVRARLPELFLPQANAPFTNGTIYEHGSRRLLCITISTGPTSIGQMMLDLSSDWG